MGSNLRELHQAADVYPVQVELQTWVQEGHSWVVQAHIWGHGPLRASPKSEGQEAAGSQQERWTVAEEEQGEKGRTRGHECDDIEQKLIKANENPDEEKRELQWGSFEAIHWVLPREPMLHANRPLWAFLDSLQKHLRHRYRRQWANWSTNKVIQVRANNDHQTEEYCIERTNSWIEKRSEQPNYQSQIFGAENCSKFQLAGWIQEENRRFLIPKWNNPAAPRHIHNTNQRKQNEYFAMPQKQSTLDRCWMQNRNQRQ